VVATFRQPFDLLAETTAIVKGIVLAQQTLDLIAKAKKRKPHATAWPAVISVTLEAPCSFRCGTLADFATIRLRRIDRLNLAKVLRLPRRGCRVLRRRVPRKRAPYLGWARANLIERQMSRLRGQLMDPRIELQRKPLPVVLPCEIGESNQGADMNFDSCANKILQFGDHQRASRIVRL
jgi:hypothetical protein